MFSCRFPFRLMTSLSGDYRFVQIDSADSADSADSMCYIRVAVKNLKSRRCRLWLSQLKAPTCPRPNSVALGSLQRPRGGESPGGGGVAGSARHGWLGPQLQSTWPWRFVVGSTWWQPEFKMQIRCFHIPNLPGRPPKTERRQQPGADDLSFWF